ncbi:MAG: hypothetical protein ABIR11_07120 [Candidatus Limnocylindrales bacterium]
MGAVFDIQGLPEVNKMLEQFEGRELTNRTRRGLRAGAAEYRKRMRVKGGGGWANRPRGFYKTRTRNHRNPLGVSVAPQSPLSTIFENGAGRHPIAPRAGSVLASGQGESPFFARGSVSHPGVTARPFVGPIFREGEADAARKFEEALFKGIR